MLTAVGFGCEDSDKFLFHTFSSTFHFPLQLVCFYNQKRNTYTSKTLTQNQSGLHLEMCHSAKQAIEPNLGMGKAVHCVCIVTQTSHALCWDMAFLLSDLSMTLHYCWNGNFTKTFYLLLTLGGQSNSDYLKQPRAWTPRLRASCPHLSHKGPVTVLANAKYRVSNNISWNLPNNSMT